MAGFTQVLKKNWAKTCMECWFPLILVREGNAATDWM